MFRCCVADDDLKMCVAFQSLRSDDSTTGVNQQEFAVSLPDCHRLAFDDADIERIRQLPLDNGIGDPAQGEQAFTNAIRVDGQHRVVAIDVDGSQQQRPAGFGAALDQDIADREASLHGCVNYGGTGLIGDA